MTIKSKISDFRTPAGADEVFFAMNSTCRSDFETEAAALLQQYEQDCSDQKCSADSEVFLRFHLSEVSRQAPILRKLLGKLDSFVSFIGQAPLTGGQIALEAWHLVHPGFEKRMVDHNGSHEVDIRFDNYEFLYHCCRQLDGRNVGWQTLQEFNTLEKALKKRGGTVAENCLRTWIYCRDIDSNYAELVNSRRDIFQKYGLTEKTNYIASTGIEGQCEGAHRLVGMDSYCVFGLKPGQVEYMQAPEHMSPTSLYGVTFERGTRIIFGDRSHYYISGTASIDRIGQIVHPGDASAQTQRTVENIAALLNNHGGTLDDLKIAVVYLRNSSDAPAVEESLAAMLPENLPRIMVKAPVCRPGWLVEIDAIGVNANNNETYKKFA